MYAFRNYTPNIAILDWNVKNNFLGRYSMDIFVIELFSGADFPGSWVFFLVSVPQITPDRLKMT